MNPEVKAKWVAALRSGEYKQGKGWLCRYEAYCCLGVLCDIYARAHAVEWSEWLYNEGAELPSELVVEWAGLPSNNPQMNARSLSSINDDGVSFAAIADIIECEL